MFSVNENKLHQVYVEDKRIKVDTLEPGMYKYFTALGNNFYTTQEYPEDLKKPMGVLAREAIDYCTDFFGKESTEIHQGLKMRQSTGVLLCGEPGTGKTYVSYYISKLFADWYKAVTLYVSTGSEFGCLHYAIDELRKQGIDAPIVILVDEFEGKLYRGDFIDNICLFLDGVNSRDKVLFIGTVNKKSELPSKITNRPSRIGFIQDFSDMDEETFYFFMKDLIPEEMLVKKNMDLKDLVNKRPEAVKTRDQAKAWLVKGLTYNNWSFE